MLDINNEKQCCVISQHDENYNVISQARLNQQGSAFYCQFFDKLKAEFEYCGEKFCILHLPMKAKENLSLFTKSNSVFYEMLSAGKTNFDYSQLCDIHISDYNTKNCSNSLSFNGSFLWTIKINSGNSIRYIYIDYSILKGIIEIKHSNFDRIHVTNAIISDYFAIEDCTIYGLYIRKSVFNSGDNPMRPHRNTREIKLPKTKIHEFNFINNICKLELRLDFSEIEEVRLDGTIFYLCPSLFNSELKSKNKTLVLPQRKNFRYKDYFAQTYTKNRFSLKQFLYFKNFKKKLKNKRGYFQSLAHEEYIKLVEIYHLVSSRSMHKEQADYFYLMQYCLEKVGKLGFFTNIISKFYRVCSDYGQNIGKSLISLFITTAIFTLIYCKFSLSMYGSELQSCSNNQNSLIIAIQQIVKPFNLIFSNCNRYMQLIGCIQSLISIALIAIFLIALRWNFRKS